MGMGTGPQIWSGVNNINIDTDVPQSFCWLCASVHMVLWYSAITAISSKSDSSVILSVHMVLWYSAMTAFSSKSDSSSDTITLGWRQVPDTLQTLSSYYHRTFLPHYIL